MSLSTEIKDRAFILNSEGRKAKTYFGFKQSLSKLTWFKKFLYRSELGGMLPRNLIRGDYGDIEGTNVWALFQRTNQHTVDYDHDPDIFKMALAECYKRNTEFSFVADRLNASTSIFDFKYTSRENDQLKIVFNQNEEIILVYANGKWAMDIPDTYKGEGWSYWRINYGVVELK